MSVGLWLGGFRLALNPASEGAQVQSLSDAELHQTPRELRRQRRAAARARAAAEKVAPGVPAPNSGPALSLNPAKPNLGEPG